MVIFWFIGDEELKVEERYWMLRGVLAMDILKPVA
jgi:hypothetical protein